MTEEPRARARARALAPAHVMNAAIVAAKIDHPYRPQYAESKWAQWCDMPPVVVSAVRGPTDPEYAPNDVWVIDVQYSTRGGRALYGIDANNVPTLYAD